MSFAPSLSLGGYAGWALLKRTLPAQTAAFVKGAEIRRDEDYFRTNIGKIKTADALVSDRRLLKVALGAFGLDGDINNKAFIRKVLADGTLTTGALANRLADKQYQKLSAAFGFGDFPIPSTQISTFPDKILSAYETRQFESAVGDQNGDLRLALNTQRDLPTIASKAGSSEDAKWFTIMGNPPLRKVFEKALGLPSALGTLDLDQQLATFKSKAAAQLGSDQVSQFTDTGKVETLIRRFLIRSEADSYSAQSGASANALAIMQQIAANARRR